MAKLSLFDNKITAYLGEKTRKYENLHIVGKFLFEYILPLLKSNVFQYTNNNQLEDTMEDDAPFIISARIINLRRNVHYLRKTFKHLWTIQNKQGVSFCGGCGALPSAGVGGTSVDFWGREGSCLSEGLSVWSF